MAMRCRYSRRLYLLKSQFHNPDYIDDTDLSFLENLITFHGDYVRNSSKPVDIEISLLPEEYQFLFTKICNNYSLISDSSLKTELYKKFDLEFKGVERHSRNIKEQIINYLQQKKGNIFTHRRVEFFLKIAMTIKHDELRKLCKEMLFSIKSPRRPNVVKRSKDFNRRTSSSLLDDNSQIPINKVHEEICTTLEGRETLLLPYFVMNHPPCSFDYEKVSSMISSFYVNDIMDTMTTASNISEVKSDSENNKTLFKTLSLKTINEKKWSWRTKQNGYTNSRPYPPKLTTSHEKSMNNMETKLDKKTFRQNVRGSMTSVNNRKSHSNDEKNRKEDLPSKVITDESPKQNITENKLLAYYKKVNRVTEALVTNNGVTYSSPLSKQVPKPPSTEISASSRERTMRYSLRNQSPPPLMDRLGLSTKDTNTSISVKSTNNEVIEISDDEDDEFELKVVPNLQDSDELIDFIIHKCSIKHSLHETLLKDYQMRIELNGFLLFVNIAIRLSIKAILDRTDKKLFECIFVSSMIIGLNCSVCIGCNGIRIDQLSETDFNIVASRLTSMQVPAKEASKERDGDRYSILVLPDLGRLMDLAMLYVNKYKITGKLCATAEVPEHLFRC